MASGAERCWRCNVQWAEEDEPQTTLRLVAGSTEDRSTPDVEVAAARRAAGRR